MLCTTLICLHKSWLIARRASLILCKQEQERVKEIYLAQVQVLKLWKVKMMKLPVCLSHHHILKHEKGQLWEKRQNILVLCKFYILTDCFGQVSIFRFILVNLVILVRSKVNGQWVSSVFRGRVVRGQVHTSYLSFFYTGKNFGQKILHRRTH